jgi:ABC-type uncharacterized transport system permease subunit
MDLPFLTDRTAIAVGTGFYAAGLLYGGWSLLARHRHSRIGGYALIALGWVVQTYGLFLRGHATHSCPIGNKFEVLQFVAWSCTLLYLFVGPAFRTSVLGFFSAGLAVALGTLSLAVPAWDSVLRVRPFGADPVVAIHASLALFSYGVLGLLALTSAMYLIQHRNLRRKRLDGAFALLPSIVDLDHINVRLLAVGVALLAIALAVAGAHWHGHPGAVAPAKLLATVTVWLLYAVALARRLRQRCVAERFAWVGLLLFLAPLLSLLIVNAPRPVAPPAAVAPAEPTP